MHNCVHCCPCVCVCVSWWKQLLFMLSLSLVSMCYLIVSRCSRRVVIHSHYNLQFSHFVRYWSSRTTSRSSNRLVSATRRLVGNWIEFCVCLCENRWNVNCVHCFDCGAVYRRLRLKLLHDDEKRWWQHICICRCLCVLCAFTILQFSIQIHFNLCVCNSKHPDRHLMHFTMANDYYEFYHYTHCSMLEYIYYFAFHIS